MKPLNHITLGLTITLLMASVPAVWAIPPLPSSFYGAVKVDGVNVLPDTVITAWTNGVQCGQTTVQTISGDTVYSLNVLGYDPDTPGKLCGRPGDTVVFHIGNLVADQTASWQSTSNVLLNLTGAAAGMPGRITVQVYPAELTVNSGATAIITTTVVDIIGNPLAGILLSGGTSPSTLGSVSIPRATNVGGQTPGTWTAGSVAGVGTLSVGNDSVTGTVPITLNNPLPAITGLSPTTTTASSPAFTLTVTGTNFVGDSKVYWNGAMRPTTFDNTTRIRAAIQAQDIAITGTVQITVVNPAPGGGTSNAATLAIVLEKYNIYLPLASAHNTR